MRTRMVREGSVGLFILLGIGAFIGLFLWLRGFAFGKSSYKALVDFANAGGMQKGAVVRYRGVNVGKITKIRPKTNGVEVEIEISPPSLLIPRQVAVLANQSGLVGAVTLDLNPLQPLPIQEVAAKPLDPNCNPQLIVCNGAHLQGEIGVSLDQLILYTTRLTNLYSNPELFNNVNALTKNASDATRSVVELSHQLNRLAISAQQQLGSLSATATAVQRTANQISASTNKTATKFSDAADQIRLTANQANHLVTNLNDLLTANRSTLVTTLNNLGQTSTQLRVALGGLTPTLNRLNQGKFLQNLETLTANTAQATANLRDITATLNSPTNRLVLQQTLDSARVTFENAQKITSDLDELTGDPKLRENLKRLINGLGGLVSSTEQQVPVAQMLESNITAMKQQTLAIPVTPTNPPAHSPQSH